MATHKTLSDALYYYGSIEVVPENNIPGIQHTSLAFIAHDCEHAPDGFFLLMLAEAGLMQDFVRAITSTVDPNPTLLKLRPIAHYAGCVMADEYTSLIQKDYANRTGIERTRYIQAIPHILTAAPFRFLGDVVPAFGEVQRSKMRDILRRGADEIDELVEEWMYRPIPWPKASDITQAA